MLESLNIVNDSMPPVAEPRGSAGQRDAGAEGQSHATSDSLEVPHNFE